MIWLKYSKTLTIWSLIFQLLLIWQWHLKERRSLIMCHHTLIKLESQLFYGKSTNLSPCSSSCKSWNLKFGLEFWERWSPQHFWSGSWNGFHHTQQEIISKYDIRVKCVLRINSVNWLLSPCYRDINKRQELSAKITYLTW